jgi:hypothetical protein
MASVSRDRADIMRCEGDQGNPGTWLWIGVDDTAALLAECAASGATIRLAPTNYPWAYEMHLEDPDGHVLRFGSEPRGTSPSRRGWNGMGEHPEGAPRSARDDPGLLTAPTPTPHAPPPDRPPGDA